MFVNDGSEKAVLLFNSRYMDQNPGPPSRHTCSSCSAVETEAPGNTLSVLMLMLEVVWTPWLGAAGLRLRTLEFKG